MIKKEAGEVIDIYDDSLAVIGSVDREQAHKMGYLHKSVHCWFVDNRFVYFQIRGENAGFAHLLDATVGGHHASGESNADALRREVTEEVGVAIDVGSTTRVGTNLMEAKVDHSFLREFSEVYMLHATDGLDTFEPNQAELQGIAAVPFREGRKLLEDSSLVLEVDTIEMHAADWKKGRMQIRKDSFIPFHTVYFWKILETGERFARGERNVSI